MQDNVCERYSHIGTAQGSEHYVWLDDPLSVPVALFLPISLFAASFCWGLTPTSGCNGSACDDICQAYGKPLCCVCGLAVLKLWV